MPHRLTMSMNKQGRSLAQTNIWVFIMILILFCFSEKAKCHHKAITVKHSMLKSQRSSCLYIQNERIKS